jgi:hypothetical protein
VRAAVVASTGIEARLLLSRPDKEELSDKRHETAHNALAMTKDPLGDPITRDTEDVTSLSDPYKTYISSTAWEEMTAGGSPKSRGLSRSVGSSKGAGSSKSEGFTEYIRTNYADDGVLAAFASVIDANPAVWAAMCDLYKTETRIGDSLRTWEVTRVARVAEPIATSLQIEAIEKEFGVRR